METHHIQKCDTKNHNSYLIPNSDDIVISGISGRFPECDNMEELTKKLFDGTDMVTDNDKRWPKDFLDVPSRFGVLKDVSKFDNSFFGIHSKQAECLDPQGKNILETTYEAIIDAGINPEELKGTNTGVYIGASFSDAKDLWHNSSFKSEAYIAPGCALTMLANRVSYSFNFKGPSACIDTACSSTFVALHSAITAMKNGEIDSAIVGGANIILQPIMSNHFLKLNMTNKEGKSKVFDKSANGYARAELNGVFLIQKLKNARRVYATIVDIKTNCDGHKDEGITYPSGLEQYALMKKLYETSNINPLDVSYIEAHGTGTSVGDPVEANSIANFFCKGRQSPLLIGSIKSNIGHAEPASGVGSIAKTIIAFESGLIPPNLHYNTPNPNIPALNDGRMQVVNKPTSLPEGLVATNSFGFGGSNVHMIMKRNHKAKKNNGDTSNISVLLMCSGRTKEAVSHWLDKFSNMALDMDLIGLSHCIYSRDIPKHPFRGFTLLETSCPTTEIVQKASDQLKREVWFVFPGVGSQWAGMGKSLMALDTFSKTIHKCAAALAPEGVDLLDCIYNGTYENIISSLVGITACQVALCDVLISLSIQPDGILGHSLGEIACGYADGCLTAEQAVLCSYFRAKSLVETELPKGAMAAIGLKWEDTINKLPPNVHGACHNSADNCTVSGLAEDVTQYVSDLTKMGVFAKMVESNGFAFHCKYIAESVSKHLSFLKKVIPQPKPRSKKWMSTSIPEKDLGSNQALMCSPEYFVNSMLAPVLFHECISHIPDNAIVIEVALHSLFRAIFTRSLSKSCTYIPLCKKMESGDLEFFLGSIGKLYNSGLNPQVSKLYPPVSFPVPRGTPMIGSLVKWDHSTTWSVPQVGSKNSNSSECEYIFDLSNNDQKYLSGHTLEGRVIFPTSGYLFILWETFAKLNNKVTSSCAILIENMKLKRTIILPEKGEVKFSVSILSGTGFFEINEGGTAVVTGFIRESEGIDIDGVVLNPPPLDTSSFSMLSEDLYKDFRLKGFEYRGFFQGIIQTDIAGNVGKVKWNDNWPAFADSVLQFPIIGAKLNHLKLPTKFKKIIIDPMQLNAAISSYKENEGLTVQQNQRLDVLKTAGFEVHGITKAIVNKRQNGKNAPLLDKYQFVPYFSNKIFKEEEALIVLLETANENIKKEGNIKVAEIGIQADPGNVLILSTKRILHVNRQSELFYISTSPDALSLESQGVTVIPKDPERSSIGDQFNVIIANDILSSPIVFSNVMQACHDGGFLILKEKYNFNQKKLLRKDLLIVSCLKGGDYFYGLIKKRSSWTIPKVIYISQSKLGWIKEVQDLINDSDKYNTDVLLVCQKEETCGILGLFNSLTKELNSQSWRCLFIDDKSAPNFSLGDKSYLNQLKQGLLVNVLRNGEWGCYRSIPIEEGRIQTQAPHVYLEALVRGDLSSLKWVEGPLMYKNKSQVNQMCSVNYSAINFKDVMLASGKIPLSSADLAREFLLGSEFSGRDPSGHRVMGTGSGISSYVQTIPEFTWRVPESWTLEEACTVPIAYLTCFYAFEMRGRLRKGDKVLIHAGSGGVGQAAISIALHKGCEVFTTVGTEVKREFLKKQFPQLKNSHISSSRDCNFEQLIMEETDGKGVNVVLNSLADDKLQASLRCLAKNGHFLEIGKYDLTNDTPMGMMILLENVSVHGVHLDELFEPEAYEQRLLLNKLMLEGISSGVVKPLPTKVFWFNEAEQAFRYMATGKHIGKVLIKMRNEDPELTIKPKPTLFPVLRKVYFHPDQVYILLGGLGGFGLVLADWMVQRGARKLVLSSRKGISNGFQLQTVRILEKDGVKILVYTGECTTEIGALELVKKSSKMGPIGGIFNLAGVLVDKLMKNQTVESFMEVLKPKLDVTLAFDKVSRLHCPDLEYFVVFSSIASSFGNYGQCNYSMANSCMERICEQRQKEELPALAIQWGPIGDVGMMYSLSENANDLTWGNLAVQRMSSCLSTLNTLLHLPHVIVSSVVMVDEQKSTLKGPSDESTILLGVANILGIKDISTMPLASTLGNLGMDSIMGTEIKQLLERDYDTFFPTQVIRGLTVADLKKISDGNITQDFPDKSKLLENWITPVETLIHLKSSPREAPKTIFLCHPIEGNVSLFKEIVVDLDYNIWGLQYTSEVPKDAIGSLANYYLQLVKKIQPYGPYILCGFSFGATVAFEMAQQIESTGETADIFLIDGSHNYTSSMFKNYEKEHDKVELVDILAYFVSLFTDHKNLEILNQLSGIPTLIKQTHKCTELFQHKTIPDEELNKIIEYFLYKIIGVESYSPARNLECNVTVFVNQDGVSRLGEDYGLKEVCNGVVDVIHLEGAHEEAVKGQNAQLIAKTIINKCN